MLPEARQRAYQQWMTWISQAAVPAGTGDFEINHTYPDTVAIEVTVPRYAVRSGDYLYFQLPMPVTAPLPAATDTRIYPLMVAEPSDRIRHWTITLPENTTVQSAPEDIAWTGPADLGDITIETATTRDDGGPAVLEVTQTIRLSPAVIPAEDYPALLELNRRLSRPAQWRVLLNLKTATAD